MRRTRVAILVSGRGANMEALVRAAAAPEYPAEPVLVVADRPDAPALGRAAALGVQAVALDRAHYPSRAAFEADLDRRLRAAGIELVLLAGFMRVMSPDFAAAWEGRMLNIHPSLLPLFPGLDTHRRALAAGVRLHGATVHRVSAVVDGGPIIAQAAVPVMTDDTPDTLAARVLRAEVRLYPAAVRQVVERRVAGATEEAVLFSPPLPTD